MMAVVTSQDPQLSPSLLRKVHAPLQLGIVNEPGSVMYVYCEIKPLSSAAVAVASLKVDPGW